MRQLGSKQRATKERKGEPAVVELSLRAQRRDGVQGEGLLGVKSFLMKPPLSGKRKVRKEKNENEFWQKKAEKLMEEKRNSLKMLSRRNQEFNNLEKNNQLLIALVREQGEIITSLQIKLERAYLLISGEKREVQLSSSLKRGSVSREKDRSLRRLLNDSQSSLGGYL